eukprot:gnl/MRDRNA2_/MRDRNA2_86799_c0_seq1.p1 gnl/MRDRNA2_/MRDRNA2_86799_c0~~gnl/MRDRNA2_/MRDRNA2_86799_c0_seq1.p1  ORF type:complete len:213 (-),score=54.88 gnl/MRDRNA2_/MRDRNA2_86799_c0_seq1:1225-1863(-)
MSSSSSKKRRREEENDAGEELPKTRVDEDVHSFCLYVLKVEEKEWKEVHGGEGVTGGGLYVGQTNNLGWRLYRHKKGWEEGTKVEVQEHGHTWEVVGTVLGMGGKEGGGKRAKSLEELVKKEKGKGFQRARFAGDAEAHKTRIEEAVKSVNDGDRSDLNAWKWWTTTLKVQWWGGDRGEKWSWKRWKTTVETFDKVVREEAIAKAMARTTKA